MLQSESNEGSRLERPILIGVTGGQGVGKSTFCKNLGKALIEKIPGGRVCIINGLGDALKAQGIPLGSAATADAVAAVYAAHLSRELEAGLGVNILDRCCVDALAYARSLGVTTKISTNLYYLISKSMARQLDFVIHLEMTGRFKQTEATHESMELRREVARAIPVIIKEFCLNHISLNAAADDGIMRATAAITAFLEASNNISRSNPEPSL